MNSVTELVDSIELCFENKPEGRKRKELSEWKININKLITEVNKLSKIKMYSAQ